MRKVRLEISKDKKKYKVKLDFDTHFTFTSKKKCDRFISSFTVLLTDYSRLLLQMQGNVYSMYNLYYFELSTRIERDVKNNLHDFDNRFEYVFKDYSVGNNNYFVLSNLHSCFYKLEHTIQTLKQFGQQYKHYSLINQASALLLNLENNQKSFTSTLKSYTPSSSHRTKSLKVVHLNKTASASCF